ncbi:RNA polymerase sigma factor (sigma-70 family) [Pseudonocardia hierapolitana]|uniref:RNA polymerase sigma factor (Sigma-70 family) n=1 Tax=Pseudonocardia hierapolitana TaxID=1128676 RepID=A0A561SLY7_9PSEU|nr:sigma-70 family RNA polymerase sigma factor [Pseudonocardia hierapolitana]TWF75877.1 RNA polymerase sigma factor (sigma-70 family) [Pseudonocardia hierapolitana]
MVSPDPVTTAAPSTGQLVRDACDRRPGAWSELASRYEGLVRAVVGSYRLQEADFADAVQNTWLRALERLHTVRDPDSLGGWLTTVARRECLALLARSRREAPTGVAEDQLVVEEPGPLAMVLAEEARRAVAHAVTELPVKPRALVSALFSTPEPNYAEVSRQMGLPIGSIGPTRQRALRTLRCGLARAGQDLCASS